MKNDLYANVGDCFISRLKGYILDGREKDSAGKIDNVNLFSISGLAKAIDVAPSSISEYINGRKLPRIDQFVAIAEALGIKNLAYLLDERCTTPNIENTDIAVCLRLTDTCIEKIERGNHEKRAVHWSWLINNLIDSPKAYELIATLTSCMAAFNRAQINTQLIDNGDRTYVQSASVSTEEHGIILREDEAFEYFLQRASDIFKEILRNAISNTDKKGTAVNAAP